MTQPLTTERLNHLLENPPLVTPPDILARQEESRKHRHIVSDIEDYKEPSYLLDPYIIAHTAVGIVGPPDSGKSMFARQLSVHIALGKEEFLGMKLSLQYRRAIYLSTEDTKEWSAHIFNKQARGLGYSRQALDRLELISGNELDGGEMMLHTTEQSLMESPADLVVVDTFGDAFMGREMNSNTEVRRTINRYTALAAKYDTTVMFIHHLRKDSYKISPEQAHVSGAQSFAAKLRLVLDLRPEQGSEVNRLLTVTKGNQLRGHHKSTRTRLALNEDLGLFTDTGDRLPLESDDSPQRVNWDKIFGLATELKTQDILQRLAGEYEMAERTATNRLAELVKVRHGVYRRRMPEERANS
ncbi:MAG TPA: AAA family ATPase [Candidatus Kapabacteria bacterium]|nr:AAA family ATPase [Candidatus Kapabacteria bacterium]